MSAARPRRLVALAVAMLIAGCSGPAASPTPGPTQAAGQSARPGAAAARPSSSSLPAASLTASAISERIGPDVLRAHLDAFQAIADGNDGTRATGTPGFERSIGYVVDVLADAGYESERTAFEVAGTTSWNVLAERAGTGAGVVILGAHVDSVMAGAGMNDNATGVTALLAIAQAIAELPAPSVTVRFAFWGAEEGGPFGSAAYVAALDEATRSEIRAYLNFDMLGSPNGVTFVYDEPHAAPGSDAITNLVTTYFERRGLPWEPINLQGHADHGPFTDAGIPTGGLFAGGREPVTDAQAGRHGASAGQPADPCSHAACDSLDNVDLARLALMTDAVAAILVALAASPSG